MKRLISTGKAARTLNTTEPPIVAGRRLWALDHVRQAARALGVLSPELENELRRAEEAPR